MRNARLIANLPIRRSRKHNTLDSSNVITRNESLEVSKSRPTKTVISPYASTSVLSFASLECSSKLSKNKSIKIKSRLSQESNKSTLSLQKRLNFLSDVRSPVPVSKQELLLFKIKSFVEEFQEISYSKDNETERCDKIFQEIIKLDTTYEPILKLIRLYLKKIINLQKIEIQKFSEELNNADQQLNELVQKLAHLKSENNHLVKNLEDIKAKYTIVSDKLVKVTKIDFAEIKFDFENWKKLLQSNKLFEETLINLNEKNKYYKSKAKKLIRLLTLLEKKGYPVEEIYANEINKKKKLPRYEGEDGILDDTDHENLLTGKVVESVFNEMIPKLNLDLLPLPSFSSEELESSSVVNSS